ncbi:ricin-type beta-trefoil lectin domain protein [Streptomyces sp. NPDC051776]|uniref:ricin-type beta-trefoil lectin domain protein n=1 Tax=Streptomyces sp. NPDC051776 TaxID=3155414 RepID=UPI003438F1FB
MRHAFRGIRLVLVAALMATPIVVSSAGSASANYYYPTTEQSGRIRSKLSGNKCLEKHAYSRSAVVGDCYGKYSAEAAATQTWELGIDGKLKLNGQCLGLLDSNMADVTIERCDFGEIQQWWYDGDGDGGFLRNRYNSKCLEIPENNLTYSLKVADCSNSLTRQRWQLDWQANGNTLPRGYRLDGTLRNGGMRLTMQDDGNLVIYADNAKLPSSPYNPNPTDPAMFSTGANGNPGAYALMQYDGNLVVYSKDGRALWASNTNGNPGSNAQMQDDGNFVVYSSGRATWRSGTHRISTTLPSGGTWNPGRWMENSKVKVLMQSNGQLAMYRKSDGTQIWFATVDDPFEYARSSGSYAYMDPDGTFRIKYRWHENRAIVNAKPWYPTYTAGSYVKLEDDGDLTVVKPNGSIDWTSNTWDNV